MTNFKSRILLITTFIFSFIIILFNTYLLNKKDTYIQNLLDLKLGTTLSLHDISIIENEFINFSYITLIVSLSIIFFILLLLNFLYTSLTFKIERYINILDKISDNIFVIDIYAKKLIFLNESAKNLLKYDKNDIKNIKIEDFLIPFNNEKTFDIEKYKRGEYLDKNLIFRAFIKAKNSSKTPVEISFSYVENKNKQYVVAVCFDISKQLILELQDSANKEIIDEHIPISQTDLKGRITYVNKAFCELTGYKEFELIGEKHSILKHDETSNEVYKELWNSIVEDKPWKGILKNKINDNKTIWTQVKIKSMYDYLGNKVGYVSTREDISYKKELEYLSEHDILTKIKNRRSFEKQLEKEINLCNRYENKQFGLIMMDIDHFKSINDTYGHQIGDLVLKNLTYTISNNLRHTDFFARWGGEEFVILSPFSTIEQLEQLTKNIQNLISNIDFKPISKLTVSFGITVYIKNDTEDSIQKRVDEALYKAKENGRNRYEII